MRVITLHNRIVVILIRNATDGILLPMIAGLEYALNASLIQPAAMKAQQPAAHQSARHAILTGILLQMGIAAIKETHGTLLT